MPRLLTILLLAAGFGLSGCVLSLRKFNTPSQANLRIQSSAATDYVVRIVGADKTMTFVPDSNGCANLDIPRLPRGCDLHLFGLIKIRDGGPENVAAIHLLRNDQVVRKMSLRKLRKLPVDTDGYFVLVLP